MAECPLPLRDYPQVLLAHGGGGTLMHDLLARVFLPAFDNPLLAAGHDGAAFDVSGVRLAMTTDSYVVKPLFFAGGDIGSLAVHGTVNDLAMCGARPLYLSAGFIIEEGLAMEALWRIVQSMRDAAREAGVHIVTGDTKVVDRGKGDGVFINTAGVGVIEAGRELAPQRVRPGDAVLISGDVGRHGVAIMAQREGLSFGTTITSDSASVVEAVEVILNAGVDVHCLRDLTRGGLASALNEIAASAGVTIEIEEPRIAVAEDVRGACELLGLDPLYVACEGRFVVFCPPAEVGRAIELLQGVDCSAAAVEIGRVVEHQGVSVTMTSHIGARRIVDMLSGEQLPRIC